MYTMPEKMKNSKPSPRRHPPWLKVRAPFGEEVHRLRSLLKGLKLNTVCQEAICPNMGECWAHGVATFMILGEICTRGCRYCAVGKGKPNELDRAEPLRVAEAIAEMRLGHVVITSVDRDDLEDGGAEIFAETIRQSKRLRPECAVEVLVPDFQGREESIRIVQDARPEIFGHNVETVPSLYRVARGGGKYDVSLSVLELAKQIAPDSITKTGIMLGLGEEPDELKRVMQDVVERGVSILTLGQYLRPTGWHLPVVKHYHPDEFAQWKEIGEAMGFAHVESGPLVRSSYLADQQLAAFSRKAPPEPSGELVVLS